MVSLAGDPTLTSVVMKSFKKLARNDIPTSLDHHQVVYRENRSMEDAAAITLQGL